MPRLKDFDRLVTSLAYPGTPANEGEVMRAWIRRHAEDYDRLDFNVRVGPANQIPAGMSESIERLNAAVGRRRVDIVAWHGNLVDLAEVKIRLTLSAIGQLKGYRALWFLDRPDVPVDRLIAVGTLAVDGVQAAYQAEAIVLELIAEEELPRVEI